MTMDNSSTADRYITFKGIDCLANTRAVVERVLMHIADPQRTNPFWERFRQRLDEADRDPQARVADRLCLACGHVYYIAELFEDVDDDEGLELLRRLEEECC